MRGQRGRVRPGRGGEPGGLPAHPPGPAALLPLPALLLARQPSALPSSTRQGSVVVHFMSDILNAKNIIYDIDIYIYRGFFFIEDGVTWKAHLVIQKERKNIRKKWGEIIKKSLIHSLIQES